jgi:hypothetical protein
MKGRYMKMNMKKKKSVIGLVAVGVLLIGTTAFAYAANDSTEITDSTETVVENGASRGNQMGMKEGGGQQQGMMEKSGLKITDKLASLVEDGTLDEDTVTEIETYLSEIAEEKAAAMAEQKAALDEMTDEEKEAYFEEEKAERESAVDEEKVSILEQMVEDGVITDDQLAAIEALMPAAGEKAQKGGCEDSEDCQMQGRGNAEGGQMQGSGNVGLNAAGGKGGR